MWQRDIPDDVIPSNLPTVEIDGVVDAIQHLNDAIVQLASHVVLNEGDKVNLGQHNFFLPEEGSRE